MINKITIIITLIIILIIVFILYVRAQKKKLSLLIDASYNCKNAKKIENRLLIKNNNNKGLSWTLSFWIYINDWNYKYKSNKYIFVWNNCTVWLSKDTNSMIIYIPIFNTGEKIIFYEVPLQKWLYITIILNNRVLDLWINGKLYTSKHLSNVPKINNKSSMKISPYGGFNGTISQFYYYSYAIKNYDFIGYNNVYSIFKQGPFGFNIPIVSGIQKYFIK